jgi:DNA invertase Pin-like site-specific DNA recombinase
VGRLTLNVLLSFAQFEREVTGERIRDKIAASKKKGMWMGGNVPLGYDADERTLVINPAEAETVRRILLSIVSSAACAGSRRRPTVLGFGSRIQTLGPTRARVSLRRTGRKKREFRERCRAEQSDVAAQIRDAESRNTARQVRSISAAQGDMPAV